MSSQKQEKPIPHWSESLLIYLNANKSNVEEDHIAEFSKFLSSKACALSINPQSFTVYNAAINTKIKEYLPPQEEIQSNLFEQKRVLSPGQARQLRKRVGWLIELAVKRKVKNPTNGGRYSFSLNFITLTLPSKQVHPDNEITAKVLNQFLTICRQSYGLKNYVWKAEKQSNGNIHYHLLTDTYMPWFKLRKSWNRSLDKLGYVSRYTARFGGMNFNQYFRYKLQHGQINRLELSRDSAAVISAERQQYEKGIKRQWKDPNSIDIHSVRNVKNMHSYISKYMAKTSEELLQGADNDEARKDIIDEIGILGKIWSSSQELSRLNIPSVDFTGATARKLVQIIKNLKLKYSCTEHNFTFYIPLKKLMPHLPEEIQNLVEDVIHESGFEPDTGT